MLFSFVLFFSALYCYRILLSMFHRWNSNRVVSLETVEIKKPRYIHTRLLPKQKLSRRFCERNFTSARAMKAAKTCRSIAEGGRKKKTASVGKTRETP